MDLMLMPFKQRIAKINDDLLHAFETETRAAAVTEEGSVTRVVFRSRGWLLSLYFGLMFLVSFVSVLIAAISSHEPLATFLTRAWPAGLMTAVLVGVTALIYFTNQGLQISDAEVIVERGVFPFRRATKIPITGIRAVRTGSFYADAISLAGEDRYVALETDRRTYRVAWGLSAEQCEAVAEAIRTRARRLHAAATEVSV